MYNTEENITATSIVATPRQNSLMQSSSAQALVQRTLGEVQVAVMMAKQFPRDKIMAKEKLVNDCCSEGLAALSLYSYARGGTEITGPTIRLAEAAKRAWGNMQSGWREISRTKGADGVGISEIEAFAWDAENNTRESLALFVRHWRDTKKGGYALTDERDIKELLANQAKRIERGCILNSIDGDMIEAALAQVATTLTTKVQVTPERVAAMVKAFADYNVTQAQIEKRIQRRIDAMNPALLISLTKIYNSLKDGMSKSADWFESEEIADDQEKEIKAKGNEGVKEKLKKNKAKESGADPETGEIKDDKKPIPNNKQKETESVTVDSVPTVLFEQLANKFKADCTAAPSSMELALLRHNNRDFLSEVMQKNPPKYNYCADNYNERMKDFGGTPDKFMPITS